MPKAPTVYDVAAHAGVSIATVSRVLRRPGDVREKTREKVFASVRELGYVPSASARGLAARRTGVIGLFFPGFEVVEAMINEAEDAPVKVVRDIPDSGHVRALDLYFDEVLRGAELEAWSQGFVLMVGVGRGADPETMVRDMAGRVDGMVVLARSVPDDVLKNMAGRIPIVLLAGPRMRDDFDHVGVMNSDGMQALTAHVVNELGVRDPVYVAGPADSPDDAERYAGFVRALHEAGIDPSGLPVLRADYLRERGRELGEQLAAARHAPAKQSLPGALICGNDQMALGILDVFTRVGVRVPEDVIITGFDGIEAARLSSPRLTTVHQPMEDLGRAAVRMMAERLAHPDAAPTTRRLPVTVLLRESSEG
jgi:LacI family transcriptional regulator